MVSPSTKYPESSGRFTACGNSGIGLEINAALAQRVRLSDFGNDGIDHGACVLLLSDEPICREALRRMDVRRSDYRPVCLVPKKHPRADDGPVPPASMGSWARLEIEAGSEP